MRQFFFLIIGLHFGCTLTDVACTNFAQKVSDVATCRPIIDLLLYEGKDAFLWLPTSFGKSICYKVLPFVFDVKLCPVGSLVVVVLLFLSLTIDKFIA